MTEPLRSDPAADAAEVPERDREARVEELLLSGLDYYFNGHLEQAINVWTRVLFLDRGHARARAYIERARSAVSERQREGEELIHSGAAAFQRGDAHAARKLITSALERGAASEEAFALLERLDRLEAAGVPQESRLGHQAPTMPRRRVDTSDGADRHRTRLAWVAAGAVCGLAGGALALTLLWARGEAWLPITAGPAPSSLAAGADDPLPVPAPAEVWLSRSRRLYERGRLHDALTALDEIRHGDPLALQADDLRATIQRALLESGRGTAPSVQPTTPPAPPGSVRP